MKIIWTERSAHALEAIGAYIAQDNPEAATRWLARLIARAEKAAVIPHGGRIVPELGRDDVREVFVRTYRIVYRSRTTRSSCSRSSREAGFCCHPTLTGWTSDGAWTGFFPSNR